MAISLSERVTVPPDVLFRVVGDEGVLVNLNTQKYLGLNAVGTQMWLTLSHAASIQAAYEALLEEYDVAAPQLLADLEEFIGELRNHQLIETGP
jgi:hypothetical protein